MQRPDSLCPASEAGLNEVSGPGSNHHSNRRPGMPFYEQGDMRRSMSLVTIGSPKEGARIYILDERLHPGADGN